MKKSDIAIGTSGFAYKEWKGSFYPEKFKDAEMLAFYAQHFKTVEINATFYRMPKSEVVLGWKERVGPDFRFVLKAPQKITHIKRLKEIDSELEFFMKNAALLEDQLGALLFQLPPNMKCDEDRLARLDKLLELVGDKARVAMEFRHPTWLSQEVYACLKKYNAALCIADTDDNQTPFEVTADFGYARLRSTQYEKSDIEAWAKKIRKATWKEAFVFFKHEDEGKGPAFAKWLQEAL